MPVKIAVYLRVRQRHQTAKIKKPHGSPSRIGNPTTQYPLEASQKKSKKDERKHDSAQPDTRKLRSKNPNKFR